MSQMCSRGLKCQQGNYKIFSFQACLNFFTKNGGEGGFTMMISPAKSGNFSHEHVWMCSEFTE